MTANSCILRVAINTPLRRLFDYLPGREHTRSNFRIGQRLRVPFGRQGNRVGLLVSLVNQSPVAKEKLKRIHDIIDPEPIISPEHLELLDWASRYYHHPAGEVMLGTLPTLLANGKPASTNPEPHWRITTSGRRFPPDEFGRAKKQRALLDFLNYHPEGVTRAQLSDQFTHWNGPLNALIEKGLVEKFFLTGEIRTVNQLPPGNVLLNGEQQQAVAAITSAVDSYQCFLLNGVTGSGKTEVYIECIREILKQGKQALVLLPEIGLTPQFIKRYQESLGVKADVMHSGLTDRERLNAWLAARDNNATVLLGTRSAVWTPFYNLGIIIVDEEHDLSFKQQEGFRYSARDMACIRAQRENIPVILGSATPSMESLENARTDRYRELTLHERAGNARLPHIDIIDMRGCRMQGALSSGLVDVIREVIDRGEQVLLFLNRRGYAPVMMCHDCGWIFHCHRCDRYLTWHKQDNRLSCHHCGHEEKPVTSCPECDGVNIVEIGHGTQRLTETLEQCFPEARILRIDRDSTRRKGSLENMFVDIREGKVDILIGTQMLAKGHHFPRVTLVGIIDADRGLYSTDFRASERLAQIIMQVSGRAGRAAQPGTVLIQTHYPRHPLLTTLISQDYAAFSRLVLEERKQTSLPPFSYHALVRAEAHDQALAERFLNNARERLDNNKKQQVTAYGPMPAPIPKKAGKYRMQLLLQAGDRNRLRRTLDPWISQLEEMQDHRKVRWSIDVDPLDML